MSDTKSLDEILAEAAEEGDEVSLVVDGDGSASD